MVAPRALDSCRRPEGSWALGTRMKQTEKTTMNLNECKDKIIVSRREETQNFKEA